MYNNFISKVFSKWVPHSDQSACERKLNNVMESLEVQHYNFNWDRTSCYVEFYYNEKFYRLQHSVEKARTKGIVLHNGLDCLVELTQSLEDLCSIVNRGMNDFETWVSGMEQSPSIKMTPEYQEELEIRYRSSGRKNDIVSDHQVEELKPFGTELSLGELEHSQLDEKSLGKDRF